MNVKVEKYPLKLLRIIYLYRIYSGKYKILMNDLKHYNELKEN